MMAFYLLLKSSVVVKGLNMLVLQLFKGKEGGKLILEFKYK